MQWLAEICVKRPVFALMLTLAMTVAGGVSYFQLGVDRFPRMDLPTIYVRTTYPGAAPEEVESEVTQVLEDAVATVEGIDELRSISSEGYSLQLITFSLRRDIDAAAQDVRDAVNSVLNRLPPGTDPPVIRKQDTDSSPILSLVVSGAGREPRELYVLAERFVKNVIESARGVGQVSISGAQERAVKVNVDARRLAAYQLSIMQVRDALARQNAEIPGGRVDEGNRELTLRTMGRFDHSREFPDLVVANVNGSAVRLRDLGETVDSEKELRTLARLDGKPAVVLQVQRQSGTNTVEVIREVKARLNRCREMLPADVDVDVIQDQSVYIEAALHEIQWHLVVGSVLASLVVFIFMGSWRSTLIAAVAIPASVIATFAAMRVLDFTLNNVTMLALVLMVGVVIDDAIVVLENVFHCIEEKGMEPFEAAIEGTREIGLAVLATTLSLVIVFLPVSFLSSITGRMLYEFGLTATVSILVSMFVSFTLTPMMCSRMLRPATKAAKAPASRRGFYGLVEALYVWCLRWSLKLRWLVLLVSLGVIGLNVPLYKMVRQDYVPTNVDESEFEIRLVAHEGATLVAMDSTLRAIEAELREVPGITRMLTTIGGRSGGGVNQATVFVKLTPIQERTVSLERLARAAWNGNWRDSLKGNFSQRDKMADVRKRVKKFTGVRFSVRNQTSLRQGAPVDIDFVVTGPSIETLSAFTEKLRVAVAEIPGIVDVDTTLRVDKPELRVIIDRARAADLGVDVREVADTLRIAVGGDDRVSRYRDRHLDDAYDVELRLVNIDRSNPDAISQLFVRTHSTGRPLGAPRSTVADTSVHDRLTRLNNVVEFREGENMSRIDRLDRQRMIAIRCNVAAGFALGDRLLAINDTVKELGLPAGCAARVIGGGRELERTFQDFRWTFILSFIFMYIILAAQLEHLVHPFTILFSLPLAVPFALFSLWYWHESLNLYSALGILVLFGVVKKAAILQVDHTSQLRLHGLDRTTAILQSNRDRLRPILMTTIAFVVGMLPLLLGTGPGAEERRSIAVVAVGGQTLSLLLTLVAVPVLYSILDDLSWLFVGVRARRPQGHPAASSTAAGVAADPTLSGPATVPH